MKVWFLNTLVSGFDLYNMLSQQVKIDGYIGLSAQRDNSDVSGYFNAADKLAGSPTAFHEFDTYNISSQHDRQLVESLDIDILIVGGWQRLIPEHLIGKCRICAVGIHGSPLGISKGRGRSPQNWALIYGMPRFEFSIFKIDKGIDSGALIATASFDYHPADNIRTSYIKSTCIAAKLIADSITSGRIMETGAHQDEADAEYFPQRTNEDGRIDWKRSANDIYNFVRALTRPYPGAYTNYGEQKLFIWQCVPFEDYAPAGHEPGTLIDILSHNELLIACGLGALIVTDHSFDGDIRSMTGKQFESADFGEQIGAIRKKHYEKYPELKISGAIRES